jgi:uncharacterized membrane protein
MLYADPGSGVLIWQILLALVFGVTFYFTKLRHWLVAKVRPERNDPSRNTAEEAYASKSISEDE